MNMTEHAAKRVQQRGIPPIIVEWLHSYGAEEHSHGACKLYFDHHARKRMARDIGAQVVDRLGDLLNAYIVVAGSRLVTAGHRTRRLRNA